MRRPASPWVAAAAACGHGEPPWCKARTDPAMSFGEIVTAYELGVAAGLSRARDALARLAEGR